MGRDEACWRHIFAPFGIPAVLIADDPDLLSTVRAAYPGWVTNAPVEPQIEIRLETSLAPSTSVGSSIRVKGSRLSLEGPDFGGHADAQERFGFARVPRRLVGEPEALAEEITDTLLLFLLTRCGRTPVHAAGIVFNDKVLVLMGPSGSGKSSLALAAAERGLSILSDDTVYVQHHPRLQLWGLQRPIHLLPEEAPGQGFALRLRGGKRKAVVPLPALAGRGHATGSIIPILLEPGEQLELKPIGADVAMAALIVLEPGFDLLPKESAAAADALTAGGAWRLTLARDPGAAIDFLLDRFADQLAPG
ncbi:MAG TPA: hypothetical protein VMN38_06845 [Sphingomicrobium sp.]|nr:hypothetical protein [Sphingomicrobium sp.]